MAYGTSSLEKGNAALWRGGRPSGAGRGQEAEARRKPQGRPRSRTEGWEGEEAVAEAAGDARGSGRDHPG